jgi:hypothetical protein
MDQAAVELKLPPWMEPAALTGFLDELREAGYNVGTAQYIAAHDLVVALTARGEDLGAPDRFRSFLGPLVCRSPREQEEFRTLFDRWVSRFEPGAGDEKAPRHASEEEVYGEIRKVGRRSRLWMLWIGLLVLLLGGLFLYLREPSPGPLVEPTPPVGEAPPPALPAWEAREIAAGLLVVLLLTLVAWRLWWRYRAHLFLVRVATTDDPRIERLAVRGLVDELFERHFLLRTIQGFRQRFEVPSRDLDIEGTIQATMRNGGWLSPAFGRRSVTPEYLVLIDRASHRDQQARLIDELVEKLEKSHVFVSRWYFDGDPRLCFPASERELPLTLAELRARFPEHRLLLFSDASGLFDFGAGELAPWVEQLAQWKQRALLTPRPIEQWRQRELALRSRLMVLPATAEGLAHLSRVFNSERPHALHAAATPSFIPEDLRLRPQRWLSRDAPEDRLVERVLDDLEQFLGDAGFYWLSACAVYPGLSWDLALYLGSELRTEEGEGLLTAERLAALSQLPWFRNGYMPDWLRLRLVGGMPRERERAVRGLLTNLLLTTLAGVRHDFYLEIAQRERRTLSRLMRQALDVLARRSPEGSALKDHVFRDFMAGRGRRRLAVRLPERIAALFSGSGATLPSTQARARRATKVLLLAGLVCIFPVFIFLFVWQFDTAWFISLWLLLAAESGTFLLGVALKSRRIAIAGASALCSLIVLMLFFFNWTEEEIKSSIRLAYTFFSLYVLGFLIGAFSVWREPKRNFPGPSWRFAAITSAASLMWITGAILGYFSYYKSSVTTPSFVVVAFLAWPCLGLFLIICGYIEKNAWLAMGGMTPALGIFSFFALGKSWSSNAMRWSLGAALLISLITSLVFVRRYFRQKSELQTFDDRT